MRCDVVAGSGVAAAAVASRLINSFKEEDHVGQAFQPDKPAPSGWKA